ncbi:MAG TPA: glycosyltransferase [Nevskiaceae bacterium]|nr:glycosyltransferase [Nevskiaceae bacterium]
MPAPEQTPPRFAVVCAAYACERWIGRCLRSLREQDYPHWQAVVIDDASPDRSHAQALEAARGEPRIQVRQAPRRRHTLANLLEATRLAAPAAEDVVVVLDGDDWLSDASALRRLAAHYRDPALWLSYGSCVLHRASSRRSRWRQRLGGAPERGQAAAYPAVVREHDLYRYFPGRFLATHLRAYRRFLWDALRDEDLRDVDGGYVRAGADVVTMWPMMEMATHRHLRYLDEVFYVYNNDHPLSDNRQTADWHASEQFRINLLTRARPRYAPLERG